MRCRTRRGRQLSAMTVWGRVFDPSGPSEARQVVDRTQSTIPAWTAVSRRVRSEVYESNFLEKTSAELPLGWTRRRPAPTQVLAEPSACYPTFLFFLRTLLG